MLCTNTGKLNEKTNDIMPNDSGKKKIPVTEENAVIYLEWKFTNNVDFLDIEHICMVSPLT